jgi:hypothetical protein
MKKNKYSWRGVITKIFDHKGNDITKQVSKIAYDGCVDGEEPEVFAAYKEGKDGLPIWLADFKDYADAVAFCLIWSERFSIESDKKQAVNMRKLALIKDPNDMSVQAEKLLLAILDSCGYVKTVKEYYNLKALKAA